MFKRVGGRSPHFRRVVLESGREDVETAIVIQIRQMFDGGPPHVFVVIATTELIVRLTRGGSVLRALKDWLVKLFDTLTGGL